MAGQQQGISLAAAAQGGLIDDIDVTILDARFAQWNYNGGIDHDILALGVQYQDGEGKTYDQYYSAGELIYFVPSEDGSRAIPVADKTMISDSCNAWKFISSLIEAGFPVPLLEAGDITCLTNMQVHVKRYAQPKRQGLIRGGKDPAKEDTVLLVDAILQLPPAAGGKKPGLAKPAVGKPAVGKPVTTRPIPTSRMGAGTPASPAGKRGLGATATSPSKVNGADTQAASDTGAGDELNLIARQIVEEIVGASGQLAKKELNTLVFRKATELVTSGVLDAKSKTKVTQICYQDSFLHGLAGEGVIVYDGATLAVPE